MKQILIFLIITATFAAQGQNVGIGETVPTKKLHVYTTTDGDGVFVDGTDAVGYFFGIAGSVKAAVGLASSTTSLSMDAVSKDLVMRTAANTQRILFNTNGGTGNSSMAIYGNNVGIGTITPGQSLTVVDAVSTNKYNGTLSVFAHNLTQGVSIGYQGIQAVGSNAAVDLAINAQGTGNVYFQVSGTTGNVGVGTTGPLSLFSVGGVGNSVYLGYFNQTTSATTNTGLVSPTGLYAVAATPTGSASYGFGIQGSITSGTGYAVGILGTSAGGSGGGGRSYGVWAQAGGATSGYNYGLFGQLLAGSGTGYGAAVYGVDLKGGYITTTPIPGTYAGWFDGNVGINGYLGIGSTTAVPQAPLHVFSASTTIANIAIRYFSYADNSTAIILTNPWTAGATTAYFQGNVLATSAFISCNGNATFSDNRIKKIIGISDRVSDLETLNKVQITKYKYIDTIGINDRIHTKVIAQQIEKIYPEAVSYTTTFIPDIYQVAPNFSYDPQKQSLTVKLANAHHLQAGDRIKWFQKDGVENIDKVNAVLDSNTFTIHTKIKPEEVFVYGKEVHDFRVVDYDALSMLNISAVQELSHKVKVLEKENELLQTTNCELNDKVNALSSSSTDIQVLQKQMSDLRSLIEKYGFTSAK